MMRRSVFSTAVVRDGVLPAADLVVVVRGVNMVFVDDVAFAIGVDFD
jgi:hypothetical protein